MIELRLPSGGSARVLTTDGERVTLLCPAASPPGSSLVVELDGAKVTVKVRGSQRVAADELGRAFRVEGRFVSLPRALRIALTNPAAPAVDPEKH
jgi:hypothetical protein